MDASSFDQADLDRLSPQDKQELRQFINNEQQKAQIQQRTYILRENSISCSASLNSVLALVASFFFSL